MRFEVAMMAPDLTARMHFHVPSFDRSPPLRASLVLVCATLLGGCASSSSYLARRWNDAKDICTVTVGLGAGAKARVGPLATGLSWTRDYAGLRGGYFGVFPPKENQSKDVELLVARWEETPSNELIQVRAKDYSSMGASFYGSPYWWTNEERPVYYYYSQIEVAVGAGGSLRVGFNPGELLDFLLGWFGADLYGDERAAPRKTLGSVSCDPVADSK